MSNYVVQQNLKENDVYKTVDYCNKNVEGISVDNLFPTNNNQISGYGNTALRANYDIVIRTQTEFDALLASSNWFGAVSVLFIGIIPIGNSPRYFETNDCITIPSNVKYIDGINSVSISIKISSENTKSKVIDGTYTGVEIKNLTFYISTEKSIIGLYGIRKMTNCSISMGSEGDPSPGFTAIYKCSNIFNTSINCNRDTEGNTEIVMFDVCYNIYNCNIKDAGSWISKVFNSCGNISNCAVSYNGNIAFDSCYNLTNIDISSTAVAGQSNNYGFNDCFNLSNCVVSNGIVAFPFYFSSHCVNCGVGENATYSGSLFTNCTKVNTNNCDS